MGQERAGHTRTSSMVCAEGVVAVPQGAVLEDINTDASRQRRSIANHIGQGRGMSMSMSFNPESSLTPACEGRDVERKTQHTISRQHSANRRNSVSATRNKHHEPSESAAPISGHVTSSPSAAMVSNGKGGTSNFEPATFREAGEHVTRESPASSSSDTPRPRRHSANQKHNTSASPEPLHHTSSATPLACEHAKIPSSATSTGNGKVGTDSSTLESSAGDVATVTGEATSCFGNVTSLPSAAAVSNGKGGTSNINLATCREAARHVTHECPVTTTSQTSSSCTQPSPQLDQQTTSTPPKTNQDLHTYTTITLASDIRESLPPAPAVNRSTERYPQTKPSQWYCQTNTHSRSIIQRDDALPNTTFERERHQRFNFAVNSSRERRSRLDLAGSLSRKRRSRSNLAATPPPGRQCRTNISTPPTISGDGNSKKLDFGSGIEGLPRINLAETQFWQRHSEPTSKEQRFEKTFCGRQSQQSSTEQCSSDEDDSSPESSDSEVPGSRRAKSTLSHLSERRLQNASTLPCAAHGGDNYLDSSFEGDFEELPRPTSTDVEASPWYCPTTPLQCTVQESNPRPIPCTEKELSHLSKIVCAGSRTSPRRKTSPGRRLLKARKEPTAVRSPGRRANIRAASLGHATAAITQATSSSTAHIISPVGITRAASSGIFAAPDIQTRRQQTASDSLPEPQLYNSEGTRQPFANLSPPSNNFSFSGPLNSIAPSPRNIDLVSQDLPEDHWSKSSNSASDLLGDSSKQHNQILDAWSQWNARILDNRLPLHRLSISAKDALSGPSLREEEVSSATNILPEFEASADQPDFEFWSSHGSPDSTSSISAGSSVASSPEDKAWARPQIQGGPYHILGISNGQSVSSTGTNIKLESIPPPHDSCESAPGESIIIDHDNEQGDEKLLPNEPSRTSTSAQKDTSLESEPYKDVEGKRYDSLQSFSAALDGSAVKHQRRSDSKGKQSPFDTFSWFSTSNTRPANKPTSTPSTQSFEGDASNTDQSPVDHEEILSHIYQILDDRMPSFEGFDRSVAYAKATTEPPITVASLSELDMTRILNNSRLRHDINFDRDLHFRPNLDGQKGVEKAEKSRMYWLALESELYLYQYTLMEQSGCLEGMQKEPESHYWEVMSGFAVWRLPFFFATIRDVLESLVPDADRPGIVARLDTDLIMQEIRHGVCDLVGLADWMKKVLKGHCAPMRDPYVNAMHKTFCRGVMEGDHRVMVRGLQKLLNVLEAMKLDVANHQIRQTRASFVGDTINFHRAYNQQRIEIGKLDIAPSKAWFEREMNGFGRTSQPQEGPEVLTAGILRLLAAGEPTTTFPQIYPQVFFLDFERLNTFQTELRTLAQQDICCRVLNRLKDETTTQAQINTAEQRLRESLTAIVGQEDYNDNLDNVAVEIIRVLFEVEEREFDLVFLTLAERWLRQCLDRLGEIYRVVAGKVKRRLLPKVQSCVRANIRLTPLELQNSLLPDVPVTTPSTQPLAYGATLTPAYAQREPQDPDTDLVKRLTHMLVLHWHIWAPLVYQRPSAQNPLTDSRGNPPPPARVQSPSRRSRSPPRMITRAVYSAKSEWIPSGLRTVVTLNNNDDDGREGTHPPQHDATSPSTPPAASPPSDTDVEMTTAPPLPTLTRTETNSKCRGEDDGDESTTKSATGSTTDESGQHPIPPSPNHKRTGDNSA